MESNLQGQYSCKNDGQAVFTWAVGVLFYMLVCGPPNKLFAPEYIAFYNMSGIGPQVKADRFKPKITVDTTERWPELDPLCKQLIWNLIITNNIGVSNFSPLHSWMYKKNLNQYSNNLFLYGLPGSPWESDDDINDWVTDDVTSEVNHDVVCPEVNHDEGCQSEKIEDVDTQLGSTQTVISQQNIAVVALKAHNEKDNVPETLKRNTNTNPVTKDSCNSKYSYRWRWV